MKTTRSGSMMAYVTVEDDTGSMELLTFSTILNQYGSLLYENAAVILNGRISVRDEKPPQMVVNRVMQVGDMKDLDAAQTARQAAAHGAYCLSENREFRAEICKKGLANPENVPRKSTGLSFTSPILVHGWARACALDERMLQELREQLGEKIVVVK